MMNTHAEVQFNSIQKTPGVERRNSNQVILMHNVRETNCHGQTVVEHAHRRIKITHKLSRTDRDVVRKWNVLSVGTQVKWFD